MRIAIINSVYNYGSTGRICYEMEAFFIKNGFECKTFYGRGAKDSNNYRFSSKLAVLFHAFLARIFDSCGLHSFFSTKKLIKMLDLYSPDFIIVHNMHGYYLNTAHFLKYIKEKNIKTIFVLHDCWMFTGHCSHFDYVKCEKWKTLCSNCPNKKEYPKSLLIDNSTNNFLLKKRCLLPIKNMIIVSPSLWMLSKLNESFLKTKRAIVINNGIDLNTFKKTESNFRKKIGAEGKNIYLFVSSLWTKKKGIDDVNAIIDLLSDNEIAVIVGKTKKKNKQSDKVYYLNKTVSKEELAEIYSASNVFINPTYEDTFSNVNMEAMSCGTPVICYKTCGASEMVDSNYVVNQGDIKRILFLARKICNDGNYNFLKSRTHFSNETMYRNYLEVINNFDQMVYKDE